MTQHLLILEFEEEEETLLLDITNLLYDLELAHDLGVLLTNKDYATYQFSRFFWYRNGRRVAKNHRLRVAKIAKQSPLVLEVVIPTLGAIWVLLQIIEKVHNWPLTRRKLELEVDKLTREREQYREQIKDQYAEQLSVLMHERDASAISESLAKRLSENPAKLARLEVKKID